MSQCKSLCCFHLAPVNVPGKAVQYAPNNWATAICVRLLYGVSGSWLCSGAALAPAVIWVVNQWLENLSLPFSLPFKQMYLKQYKYYHSYFRFLKLQEFLTSKKKLPCQYTRSGCDTTQAFNTRLNFAWPSGDDNSSSYWWQRGISTSICKTEKQQSTSAKNRSEVQYTLNLYFYIRNKEEWL